MNRPIGHVGVGVGFTSMNRLQAERDEIASEKRGFHMTIKGDLRHFHNQCIDDARSDVIEIRRLAEGDPLDFEVVVREGRGETRHRVTMSRDDAVFRASCSAAS
jgi:hypothetical protein